MKKVSYLLVMSLVFLGVSTAAIAQNTVGILTLGDPVTPGNPVAFDGINPNYKTPPLVDSQQITVFIGGHIGTPMYNFMGALWQVHMGDAMEVSFVATASLTGPPFGSVTTMIPGSSPVFNSMVVTGSQFLNTALLGTPVPPSGITLVPSDAAPFGALIIHAKNTTPALNSDIDLTIQGWGIFHVPGVAGSSTFLSLAESDWVYGAGGINPITASELPFPPPEIGAGTWFKVGPGQTKALHLSPGAGSYFIAKILGTGVVGIEHVPEPTTGGLLAACGAVVLLGGRAARRRRLALS